MNSAFVGMVLVLCAADADANEKAKAADANEKVKTDLTEKQIRELVVQERQDAYKKAKQALKDIPEQRKGKRAAERSYLKAIKVRAANLVSDYEKNIKLLDNVKDGPEKIPVSWLEPLHVKVLVVDQVFAPSTFVGKMIDATELYSTSKGRIVGSDEVPTWLLFRGWDTKDFVKSDEIVTLDAWVVWGGTVTFENRDGGTSSVVQVVRIPNDWIADLPPKTAKKAAGAKPGKRDK